MTLLQSLTEDILTYKQEFPNHSQQQMKFAFVNVEVTQSQILVGYWL